MGNESLAPEEHLTSTEHSETTLALLSENSSIDRDRTTTTTECHPETDATIRSETRLESSRETVDEVSDEFMVKYRGKKYDISDLLKKHPGGSKILKHYRGLSIDEALKSNPHSEAAFHLFEEFLQANEESYQEIEKLVDWEKPLLWQVSSLGDRYWEWVNLPVNRSIRLFDSDILERLTVTPWYMVPICWIPITTFLLIRGYFLTVTGNSVDLLPRLMFALGLGFLLWTLFEYTVHRKLFHMQPPSGSRVLIALHFLLHGLHHKAPFDGQRLVFPVIPAMVLGFLIYSSYKFCFSEQITDFVAAGTMLGYLFYDLTHYYLHYGAPKAETYMYVMKRYHNYHHFSHHGEGFGISSRLWDYAFGTLITLRKLKNAIEW